MKDTQVILEIIKELRADASLNYKKEVLARFVEVREDKNTATSYEEIIG